MAETDYSENGGQTAAKAVAQAGAKAEAEKEAGDEKKRRSKKFGLPDFLVVVFCVFGAAVSLNLFYRDLFRTMAFLDQEPVGTVTIRYNNVQRRLADRVKWDRLVSESPVFQGDLIRVADHSAAHLSIHGSEIDLGANTIIRVNFAEDDSGQVMLDLDSGIVNVAGGGIAISFMDNVIAPTDGTVFSLQAGEDGMEMQVIEGTVAISAGLDGEPRLIETGEILSIDADGVEQFLPSAVMLYPRPIARFLQTDYGGHDVDFRWNLVNIEQQQPVRLRVSRDRDFNQIDFEAVYFQNNASINLDAGMWHWQLIYEDIILRQGHFTIVSGVVSALLSPVQGSVIPYTESVPAVRFEWMPVEGVTHYVFQIASSPDFLNPIITRQVASAFFVEQNKLEGYWYWRVMPVFPPFFLGQPGFSTASSFSIERVYEHELALLQEAELQRLSETAVALMLAPPEPPLEPLLPPPAPVIVVPAVLDFIMEVIPPPVATGLVIEPIVPPSAAGLTVELAPAPAAPAAGGIVIEVLPHPAAGDSAAVIDDTRVVY